MIAGTVGILTIMLASLDLAGGITALVRWVAFAAVDAVFAQALLVASRAVFIWPVAISTAQCDLGADFLSASRPVLLSLLDLLEMG